MGTSSTWLVSRVLAFAVMSAAAGCAGCKSDPTAAYAPPAADDSKAAASDGNTGPDAKQDTQGSADGSDTLVPQRALFIGNSYTEQNNLPALYAGLASGSHLYKSVETQAVTPGAYDLAQHAADAQKDGSALRRWLWSGTKDELRWDVVVVQDQSQVPGLAADNPSRIASSAGAVELADRIDMLGAAMVLYMTWGRRDGDSTNAQDFPDFATMQAHLEAGYRGYAAAIRKAGHAVSIAPVGLAFAEVHDDKAAAIPFAELYAPDGSHPSLAGSYLAACVLLATISKTNANELKAGTPAIDAAQARYLRAVAERVVEAERKRGQ